MRLCWIAITIAAAVAGAACEKKTEPAGDAPSSSGAPSSSAAPPPASTVVAAPSAESVASAATAAPETITAQHVLVAWKGSKGAPPGVTRSKAEAKARADEVARRAKGGDDFTELVATYSDDLGTKDRLGSLGKFDRRRMVKPFSDAAFALAVGEVSDPVETPYGYHVIKRNQ